MDPDQFSVSKKANWKGKPPVVFVKLTPQCQESTTDAENNSKKGNKTKCTTELGDEDDSEFKQIKEIEEKEFNENPQTTLPVNYQQIKETAGTMVESGIRLLNCGKFSESHGTFVQAIAFLVNFSPQSYQIFQAELLFAIRYAQATQFLQELLNLQERQQYKQMALISSFLGDLPLQMQHTLIHLRLAIKLNFLVGNFGTVGRLIQVIAGIAMGAGLQLPEQALLEEMLDVCNQHFCKDTSIPVGNFPSASILLCFGTMRLLQGQDYVQCPFCASTYYPSILINCSFCNSALQSMHLSSLQRV
eukprot:TRINITY_DN6323_c0_g1_i58.p1 TRINITY_DN6323_c0_g1~~TRINITY_DN6323_c0_g1_i58.p1  ORF type:complete len:303 (+),score=75.07 TRINITY_DN6323_c0_g1_i58:489-1397(+)